MKVRVTLTAEVTYEKEMDVSKEEVAMLRRNERNCGGSDITPDDFGMNVGDIVDAIVSDAEIEVLK